ncbi:O(6)-methylguanine-induced apoptosis 2 [Sceloporus undulatus]|uniref:O(6)-methylguanine-induced apoptosis 2 n=1 Tax=Sceloporus undulatus TaxID=8520 RepID=UPI001C4BCD23|nr:O(6)-methylguanine-induced apoptosis 2 [Sceloporus undulatus]
MGNLSRSGSKVRKKGAPDPSPEGPNYSTIPFKFQTKVISNTERIGFNSQTKRFQEIENENPGPGCYNITHPSAVQNTVSQSRKGTCFFPSLDVRIARQRIPSYPAANAYDLPPTFQSKRDFSLGYSSMFQQPIARKISKRSTPAPNQYNVSRDLSKQNGYRGVKSVFTSKTKRSLTLYGKDRVPSPCHYEINDSFVRQAPTALVSCFRSRTKRETKPETLSPGPAAYQQPDKIPAATPRIKFPGLRKYGLNFSAPPLPRPKSPPSPGPGQYEIANFSGAPKHYISSAVFVSNTGRWSGDTFNEEVPGPGAYNLPIPRKQSFIYNAENKWLPAL